MKSTRRIVWLGSAILTATAAFHGTGYSGVEAAVAESNLEGVLSGAIGGLWLFASVHWLFLAILAVVAVRFCSRASRWTLGLVASVLVADIVMLFVHLGPFVGEVMLGVASLAYAGAAWLSPAQSRGTGTE